MKKRRINAKVARNLEGTLFIAPWMLGFLIFLAFPLGFSLFMSFHQVKILPTGMKYEFNGIKYYREILFNSSEFYDELIPYFQEIILMVPIIIIFSLLIAILLNQKLYGRFLFRTIFFLPVIFTTGYLLTEFVNQGEGSLGFLERFSLGEYLDTFLGNSTWGNSVKTILNRFVLVLWYSGVQILIFLAGRQTISNSAYESARIDGANPWEVFWKITLPAMTPFIFLNLIYTVVDMFTFPFNPIIDLIGTGNYGYSSALAWVYFLIIFIFLMIVMFIFVRINKRQRAATR
ncbi:carbohydrate ABC transporter permease [Lederbergia galactosidilytica]|uniref:ABC transporter permease n=1 Tax=Lederbergia galactosidilytica TaxID=217031 RepID=A0A177ZS99_9BACI|nr:sugar ABC transporter permease [Lederbergia galactosidilytica]KRG12946.1 ABC transporter permease [Virgibacillus soli]MBP1916174.1 ABC-type sugar transport system permease subunit [Lederbergia galactosidilytica]OAK70190.1 ABC transporter permease [Lederbergia galactosidilytica]